jgi:thiol-disulfide isomerase/thioredoxin
MIKKYKYILIFLVLGIFYSLFVNDNNKYQDFPKDNNLISFMDNKSLFKTKKDSIFIVNFFASWCGACHRYNHHLLNLPSDINIPIYGVSFDENLSSLQSFFAYYGNPYKDVFVDKYNEIGSQLEIRSLPQTLLVKNGKIIKRYKGGMSINEIKSISKEDAKKWTWY